MSKTGNIETINLPFLDQYKNKIKSSHLKNDKLNIFNSEYLVEDVWRYVINVKNNTIIKKEIKKTIKNSYFSDQLATNAIGSNILLLLESPHRYEYIFPSMKPKAPAQAKTPGGAGGAIDKYIEKVLLSLNNNIPDGTYNLIIANPIQYMCSLYHILPEGKINTNIRDNTWKALWELESIKSDFISRVSKYDPYMVINCCTSELKQFVTTELQRHNINNIFEKDHPAMRWMYEYELKD
ncbi:hypothetical protein GLP31_05620 [Photobacterium carnosum]|uniref:hypothetical protein n=1 Tax=Photobacterium carnosum TaxID=2023717 RepID=UPI001E2CEF40|nr:hypothetical protein [Photobacterium carnosum]MCD9551954.1 hypothetical protein [Photobacterium carnosum]